MQRRQILSSLLFAAALGAAPGSALASSDAKKEEKAVTFFQLDPINAIVLRRDGRRGVMTVEAGMEVKDPELMKRAQASTPRLRAAFAQALTVYAAGLRGGMAPDIDYVARELQKAADRVLGKPGSKVLLGSAMIS